MIAILRELGATVERRDEHRLRINCSGVTPITRPSSLVERLRASIVLMGPLLARFGRANMHHPGGDAIGTRSIGTHIHALEALGSRPSRFEDNFYQPHARQHCGLAIGHLSRRSIASRPPKMRCCLAAARPRLTHHRNAASEPHIMNLAECFTDMGADVDGAGSNVLHDRGARAICGVPATSVARSCRGRNVRRARSRLRGGDVTIRNVIPDHLEMVLLVLDKMGVQLRTWEGTMQVRPSSDLRAVQDPDRSLARVSRPISPRFSSSSQPRLRE